EAVKDQVHKAADTLDKADTRAKMMQRALKKVEALPEGQAQVLLPLAEAGDDAEP
ncbi:MAG TPA: DNA recombination protein RmuC, partial [Ramlibacter sp.]|nr:DNA recombination protein RmuC [Ramlibacter sp.]